jgi:hypothetical protein
MIRNTSHVLYKESLLTNLKKIRKKHRYGDRCDLCVCWYVVRSEIYITLLSIYLPKTQGSRLIIVVVVHVGAVKIYVASLEAAIRKKERQDETQCTTKIGGKFSLDPSYVVFIKFSFPVTYLMHYYAETGRSCPPNRLTLQNTLINNKIYKVTYLKLTSKTFFAVCLECAHWLSLDPMVGGLTHLYIKHWKFFNSHLFWLNSQERVWI